MEQARWRRERRTDRVAGTILAWGGLLFALTLNGCSGGPPLEGPVIQNTFRAAVRDAAVADPWEISRNLRAIVEYERDLVWRDQPGQSPVLVVTWTGWTGYDDSLGQDIDLDRPVWVTLVPDIRRFCSALKDRREGALGLRLEQLLGLQPRREKDRFVEIWVDREDLFRPCPDPEVTDRECGLYFPVSDRFVNVSEEHKSWYSERRESSYGEDGLPWTGLGYTYDWGNPASEVGLSEFVIRSGARVGIHAVTPTASYCGR